MQVFDSSALLGAQKNAKVQRKRNSAGAAVSIGGRSRSAAGPVPAVAAIRRQEPIQGQLAGGSAGSPSGFLAGCWIRFIPLLWVLHIGQARTTLERRLPPATPLSLPPLLGRNSANEAGTARRGFHCEHALQNAADFADLSMQISESGMQTLQ